MRRIIIGLSALAISALPTLALADGDGALTGAAGGAVTGAVVGGPVGAVVGGVAGAAIGGAASGPGPVVVAPEPARCNTRTTTTQNNNTGASVTRQTTDCANSAWRCLTTRATGRVLSARPDAARGKEVHPSAGKGARSQPPGASVSSGRMRPPSHLDGIVRRARRRLFSSASLRRPSKRPSWGQIRADSLLLTRLCAGRRLNPVFPPRPVIFELHELIHREIRQGDADRHFLRLQLAHRRTP
jgi:hypothetical protein